MPYESLIQAAQGRIDCDLLLTHARIINVFNGRIDEGCIAIHGGLIAALDRRPARREIDLGGRWVAPGFIDAHVHMESAMTVPARFARAVLPHGTTTVVADPHEIANVLGTAGIAYMLSASEGLPLQCLFALSSCVPATGMETAGARLTAADLAPFWSHPRIVALAEMMNFPGVLAADTEVLAKITAAETRGKPVDGHAPGLSGAGLAAYIAAGVDSDHECTRPEEALEKLAAGMRIMIREGTGAKNLDDLLPIVTDDNWSRIMWCTDDRHPHDLIAEGHIDALVRRAIAAGMDPVRAIRMATLAPAEYFHLRRCGALAPGRRADLVVLDDLASVAIHQVWASGQQAAADGAMILEDDDAGEAAPTVMRLDPASLNLAIPATGVQIRVIEIVPGQVVTGSSQAPVSVRDGLAVADPSRDLLKLVVVERYSGHGQTGIGFARGFGLRNGALASSVAHDSHNIIAVGVNDEDLRTAIAAVAGMGGGLAVAAGGEVRSRLPLPVAGLMSPEPLETVRDHLDRLNAAARELGGRLNDPFMTLSFLALPVIPELKLTDQGLVDVVHFAPVPLFV
ncbi:MAG: adenine deaminase [Desulfobacterales bacterium]|jgi:adenine deaminase|nr:adenine deaminase [Desulfobacteraceae bacterium]MDY0312498.1 adenine deaminase [Desulfobacterales bacterium]